LATSPWQSSSPEETAALGERLGRLLLAGDAVLLEGELGTGKTCFTQGLARGLDIADPVKSSSFILLAEYQGRLRLYHADLFRLTSPEEVADLQLDVYSSDGVLVVEWPERAPKELPEEHLLLRFSYAGDTERTIEPIPRGERAEKLAAAFMEAAKSS
jgi:tRNA threonylcarbamoyladenosine biosynthesis protein TsaE